MHIYTLYRAITPTPPPKKPSFTAISPPRNRRNGSPTSAITQRGRFWNPSPTSPGMTCRARISSARMTWDCRWRSRRALRGGWGARARSGAKAPIRRFWVCWNRSSRGWNRLSWTSRGTIYNITKTFICCCMLSVRIEDVLWRDLWQKYTKEYARTPRQ